MKLVDVEHVWYSYGPRPGDGPWALEDVTFGLEEGRIVTVIGPNGAGKSTLLKLLTGELRPVRGSIRYFGKDLADVKRAEFSVGYIPQFNDMHLRFPIGVAEVVGMGLFREIAPGVPAPRSFKARVRTVLEAVRIGHLADRTMDALSGGERQKVLIARALVSEPKVLILDEPISGFDAGSEEMFYGMLKDLRKERGLSVILSTHDLNIVPQISDHTLCLNRRMAFHDGTEGFLDCDLFKERFDSSVEVYLHSHGIPHRTVKEK
jgi:ABC-type Mn2+/Zn2+ transport system ATPase subunit